MAQQVEHVLGKDEVTGSNPVSSSILGKNGVKNAVFALFLPVLGVKIERFLVFWGVNWGVKSLIYTPFSFVAMPAMLCQCYNYVINLTLDICSCINSSSKWV